MGETRVIELIKTAQAPNGTQVGDKQVGIYRETKSGLVRVSVSKEGEVTFPLTNFTARIIADVTRDDGAETSRAFEIDLKLGKRSNLVTVPTSTFPAMRWPIDACGAEAILYAGQGVADHTRAAIQLLSSTAPIPRRTVYQHVGWRKVDNGWVYLHGGGAIGEHGLVEGIEVSLPPELASFILSPPANPADAIHAIRASLRFLELGPDEITIPLYGTIWRAIIGGADFSVFEYGKTGSFKTARAALLQQHYGAGFDALHLPASFTSSGNTNEALAFFCKDALLVIDEFHPPSGGTERDRMHRDAARVLRAQGNASGRGRMRPDGTLRPVKPPRGMLIATGEEQIRGQSLHARMFTIEVIKGDLDMDKLSSCQRDGANGLYVQATTSFIMWLAPRLEEVRKEFRNLVNEERRHLRFQHPRTNDICAQLIATYVVFSMFLHDMGAEDEAEYLSGRSRAALLKTAEMQAQFAQSVDPCDRYVELLRAAITAGTAHLADKTSLSAPLGHEEACGWRKVIIGAGQYERTDWQPQGQRIGWVDGDDLYLEPTASYRTAQRMVSDGVGIEVSATTLTRRLRDRGWLRSRDEKRHTLTTRRKMEGRYHDVLHLAGTLIGLSLTDKPDIPDIGV